MSCICTRIKKYFYVNGFVLSLALKQRIGATRKWPKSCDKTKQLHNKGVQLWDTNMAAVLLVWDTNMATVTSCEKVIFQLLSLNMKPYGVTIQMKATK